MQDHCNGSSTLVDPVGQTSRAAGHKDEIGKRYGRLTVVGRLHLKRSLKMHGRAVFNCRCSCGNEISVSGNLLRKGAFRECGSCAQAWRDANAQSK